MRRGIRRGALIAVIALAAALSLAAVTSAASNLKISADKSQLKFNKKTLKAKAGKITIVMANPSSFPHAIAVKGKGQNKKGKTVGKGKNSTVTLTLKKGTYTFYCPVPGHEAAGMKGTLKVS
jgi:plastocyanin